MKIPRSFEMAFSIIKFRGRTGLLTVVGFMAVVVSLSAMATGPRFITVSANPSVSIDTDTLRPGDVRFYAYRDHAGDRVRFLLARDATGQIKGALDACRPCAMYGEGYASSRGYLVCRYCGNRYKLEAMESGLASCVPLKLPIQMAGHTVNIKPEDR